MKPIFVTFFVLPLVSFAAPVRDVRQLRVVVEKPGGASSRTVIYEQQPQPGKLRLVSPHPYKNPKKETQTWNGVTLRDLLKSDLSADQDREVVIAGASGYSAQVTEKAIRDHGILVALSRDGKGLTPSDGGPQLVYPIADETLPAALRSDAWWVWYVSGIFVGRPEPVTAVRLDAATSVRVDLRRVRHEKRRMTACYPAGQRQVPPPKSKVEVSLVPLGAVIGQSGKPVAKVIVHNHLGTSVDVTSRPEDYWLAFAWNGETIRPSFGGPVQLVRRGPTPQCLYFVESVEL